MFRPRLSPTVTRRRLLGAAGSVAAGTSVLPGVAEALPVVPYADVRLVVEPNPVPVDAPFGVRLTGLPPGRGVTIRSFLVDAGQRTWSAFAAYQADQSGTVNLSAQAPIDGSFATVDPMGLVWAALPEGGGDVLFLTASTQDIALEAQIDGVVVARTVVQRLPPWTGLEVATVEEDGIFGTFVRPTTEDAIPGILVLGGSEGGLNPSIATLLASHGYAALALAYFNYRTLPVHLANIPLEYFSTALGWLGRQPGVRADRLAIFGSSRGGELALILGAVFPQIQAVVSYVGSGLVSPSPDDPSVAAWTLEGNPFVDPGELPWYRAAILVERVNGPILLVSGIDDRLWPSSALSELAYNRLRTTAHPFPDQHLRYPEAGHFILPPFAPTGAGRLTYGGTAQGIAHADADSWPRVLATLDARLNR